MAKTPSESVGREGVDGQQNVSPAADTFYLERIYPEAEALLKRHAVGPASDKSLLISLDTNALLLPYQIKSGNVNAVGRLFEQLAGEARLFVAGRVIREFVKLRDEKLGAIIADLNKRRARFSGDMPPLLSTITDHDHAMSAYDELSKAHDKYVVSLDKLVTQIKKWRGDDPIATVYGRVFSKESIIDLPWDETAQAEYLKERDWRYRNKIPPGYKDASKDDGGIGDLLIWKSLLALGEKHKRDLAFVTGERKSDWFTRADGEPIYPRQELVDEYRRASGGRSFRLMSLYELLEEMEAPAEVVLEVKQAEAQANTAALLERSFPSSEIGGAVNLPQLRFFSDTFQSFWGLAKNGDQIGTQVHGLWSVTNVSDKDVYVMQARLVGHEASYSHVLVEDVASRMFGMRNPIRPGQLARLATDFFFFPPITDDGKPFVTDVAFTDSLNNDYLIRSVRFNRAG